ncbi:MAG TPA: chitosanase [Solirubrobacteraceae bacterium]
MSPAAEAAGGFTAGQRSRADQLVSLFENSTTEIQYCYVEALGDGRGYTAGRAGFTSATGDMVTVVDRFTAEAPENPLARYAPRLRELSAGEDGSTEGLEGLPDAWRATCDDPRQRAAQDAVVDDLYYRPSVRRWRALGLRRALTLAALYDAMIQHGEGDDPDGVPALLRRARRRAGGTPRTGVSERRFLRAFLAVRRATLRHATDPGTRAVWAESVGRVDVFAYLLRTGQWALRAPVRVRTREYRVTLR